MSAQPDPELINEIAVELGVSPSFVEKDWYAVQVIRFIAEADFGDITPVFSGGTSLSKGYGLIQRFSEDMDFKVKAETQKTKNECRSFRQRVIEIIGAQESFTIDKQSIKSQDGSKFFSCNIAYPQNFELDDALRRTGLQLEMRIQNDPLLSEDRPIGSFVSQFTEEKPETRILCIQPIETAADKFNALLWRLLTRKRTDDLGTRDNDPTIIRHLHDLCALKEVVIIEGDFIPLTKTTFTKDIGRRGSDATLSIEQAIQQVQKIINSEDDQYRKEYDQFVAAMSYARDDEMITYDRSLQAFTEIAELVVSR